MRSKIVNKMLKKKVSLNVMNKTTRFYSRWVNSEKGFSRFELYLSHPLHFKYKNYFYLNLIPVIAFDFDNQFNVAFRYRDNELHESEVGIGVMLEWLGLKLNFQVNFKTNKPEVKEKE